MKTAALSFAALALAVPAMPILAAPAAQTETIHVEYRDLNLGTPEGQKRLDRRVRDAAKKACGLAEIATGTRIPSAESNTCYKAALVQARERVAAKIEQDATGG